MAYTDMHAEKCLANYHKRIPQTEQKELEWNIYSTRKGLVESVFSDPEFCSDFLAYAQNQSKVNSDPRRMFNTTGSYDDFFSRARALQNTDGTLIDVVGDYEPKLKVVELLSFGKEDYAYAQDGLAEIAKSADPLLRANVLFASRIAKLYFPKGSKMYSFSDYATTGLEGLYEAMLTHKPSLANIRTYGKHKIKSNIFRLYTRERAKKRSAPEIPLVSRRVMHYDDEGEANEVEISDWHEDPNAISSVSQLDIHMPIEIYQLPDVIAKAKLDDREKLVMDLRFPADGAGLTLEKAGREFGVTRERVRQIQNGALRKLRRSAYQFNENPDRERQVALEQLKAHEEARLNEERKRVETLLPSKIGDIDVTEAQLELVQARINGRVHF